MLMAMKPRGMLIWLIRVECCRSCCNIEKVDILCVCSLYR